MEWYPQERAELNKVLERFLSQKIPKINQKIHGLIVPHAGYEFSGAIAGKAFSLLKENQQDTAIILGPSHYIGFEGVRVLEKKETPLGKVNIMKNNFEKIGYEHSVDNQIPFLQKLNFKSILPLIVGQLSEKNVQEIIEKILKVSGVYIFSSDLSHFLPYEKAIKIDKETIKIIENLDIKNWKKIEACGKFPLLIMMKLCKQKGWKPKLIEYKNSGDVVSETKNQGVVGYASFWF